MSWFGKSTIFGQLSKVHSTFVPVFLPEKLSQTKKNLCKYTIAYSFHFDAKFLIILCNSLEVCK